MRKLLAIALVLTVTAIVASIRTTSVMALVEPFTVKFHASKGKSLSKLPVVIGDAETSLGATNGDGELELAEDPSKNGKRYNAYRVACNKIALYEPESEKDRECKQKAQSNTGKNECEDCLPLGFFIFGKNASVGEPGGSHTTRNVILGSLAAAGGITGAVLATNGNGSNGTAAQPQFAGLSRTIQLTNLVGNAGCPGFTPTATAALTISIDPNTGLGTLRVQYSGSETNYPNGRAVREGNQNVITGSGAIVLTPIRNFTADVRVVLDTATFGVSSFVENFLQTTGAGSPCTQTYRQ